jgi:hypothetical protein
MRVYFGSFGSREEMINGFDINSEQLEGVEILYACYDSGDYEGEAHVIFRKEDKLYEVNGAHCSCYGLEGQWKPEETSVAALLFRPNVAEEAKEILRAL